MGQRDWSSDGLHGSPEQLKCEQIPNLKDTNDLYASGWGTTLILLATSARDRDLPRYCSKIQSSIKSTKSATMSH